jgi:hypothetical protein
MRRSISSAIVALAALTVSAAPALACGYGYHACVPYTPTYTYAPTYGCATGCNTGWAFGHFAEPMGQYYYVNQGPTYTGPGAFAPVPTYQESTVSGWDGYHARPYYEGAGVAGPAVYGHRWHHHHAYRWHGHRYGMTPYHHSPRYGYMPYH